MSLDVYGDILHALRNSVTAPLSASFPFYDIIDGDTERIINLAVAGYPRESLSVEQTGSVLKISGKPSAQHPESKYLRRSIKSSNFEISFIIGDSNEVSSVELKDGILSIRIKPNLSHVTSFPIK